MPLYEYQCDACGHRFERIQKFSDPPADTCPSCGAGPVRKLLSSPAIQFKGTGWYITDYAKKDQARAGKTESKESSGSGETKSEKSSSTDASSSSSSASSSTPSTTPSSSSNKS